MTTLDKLVSTVEAIHAAGLDPKLWPQALQATARLFDVTAATLEHIDNRTLSHCDFHCFGVPPVQELKYLNDYAPLNVRLPFHAKAKAGEVLWDYKVLDETAMNHAPFYAEFLAPIGFRYFLSGVLDADDGAYALVSLQRTKKEGHCSQADIALMRRLMPHVRQGFDVTRRLKYASGARASLESTLDWLADGVALLRADGRVVYCNESFQAITGRGDGIRLRNGMIEIADGDARDRFARATAAVFKIKAGAPDSASDVDLTARRRAGSPAYLVSVRPLFGAEATQQASAAAIVFVHDPMRHGATTISALRDRFGLTEAETALAQALQAGLTVAAYAQQRSLSLNTVYSHLRRLREKTGCNRMPELIRKLNDLQVPLRGD